MGTDKTQLNVQETAFEEIIRTILSWQQLCIAREQTLVKFRLTEAYFKKKKRMETHGQTKKNITDGINITRIYCLSPPSPSSSKCSDGCHQDSTTARLQLFFQLFLTASTRAERLAQQLSLFLSSLFCSAYPVLYS